MAPAIAAGLGSAIAVLGGSSAAATAAAVTTLGGTAAGTAAITGTFGVIGASHAASKAVTLYGRAIGQCGRVAVWYSGRAGLGDFHHEDPLWLVFMLYWKSQKVLWTAVVDWIGGTSS